MNPDLKIKIGDICYTKKRFRYLNRNIDLKRGEKMICVDIYRNNPSMSPIDDKENHIQFCSTITNPLRILYFWKFLETRQNRRKRIIKEVING